MPNEEEHRTDTLDVAYGGLSLTAKGSIIVLVILLIVNGALVLMTYGWVNIKIDAVVNPQNVVLSDIITKLGEHRGHTMSESKVLRDDIVRNRDYLREIARVCLLSEKQRANLQDQMPMSLRELLLRREDRP